MKIETTRLSDFLPTHHNTPGDTYHLDAPPLCPHCGGSDVVRRGKGKRKRRDDQQRYYCNYCHQRFIDSSLRTHFHDWVIDNVLALTAEGARPRMITKQITRISKLAGRKASISTHSVWSLVRKAIINPLRFEFLAKREVEATRIWVIDDAFERFPARGLDDTFGRFPARGRKRFSARGGRRVVGWITNIYELGTNYWLAAYVSLERDKDITSEAFRLAVKRAKGTPLKVKCDGLRSHVLGIRELYPWIEIDSRKKDLNYGWINEIESLHNTMRQAGISRHGFRSPKNLQARLELFRLHYNFLRSHESLEGETPARVAGIIYPQTSDWSEFIRFARWYVLSQKNWRSRGG